MDKQPEGQGNKNSFNKGGYSEEREGENGYVALPVACISRKRDGSSVLEDSI